MKKSKIAKIVLPLFLITAMLFCMTACGAKSAEKYIGVKFDGYDGFGSATVEIDTKAVKDDFNIDKIDKYFDKLKDEAKENDEDVYYELKQISLDKLQKKDPLNVFYDIEIEGENKNLKNGDQVTVTIDVSKTLDDLGISREDIEKGTGIKLPESKEFTVEG
ncbi:MAG: hypothetical protein II702_04060, partial [Clostridia bacterium]|nr:hypothetical protein [Clostridia bacterium]